MDIQRPDGNLATHGPTTLWGFEQSCPSYSLFLYEFCRYCHLFDGDDRMISAYYDRLVKGVSFFEVLTRDDHLCHVGYGAIDVMSSGEVISTLPFNILDIAIE